MKVVGHRGTRTTAPENTLAAFRAAKSAGADAVELDVQQTADGQLVVIHDYALERTTNGTGFVWDSSASEVRALDAGSWFGPDFEGELVPLLTDVLALDSLEFEVELKVFNEVGMLNALDVIREAGVLHRVEFTSSNFPMLVALKAMCPKATIGIFTQPQDPLMADTLFERTVLANAEFTTADVVHVSASGITPAIAAKLHEQGRIVHANDAKTEDDLARALEAGADRTSVDDPVSAVAHLNDL